MTYLEIVAEAVQLPLEQKRALIQALTQSLTQESPNPARTTRVVDRLFGVFATSDPAPTDEELKDESINDLIKKYA